MITRLEIEGSVADYVKIKKEVENCVDKTRQAQNLLDNYMLRSYELASGEQVYVLKTDTTCNVRVILPKKTPTSFSWLDKELNFSPMEGVADFVSGVVKRPRVEQTERSVVRIENGEEVEVGIEDYKIREFLGTEVSLSRIDQTQSELKLGIAENYQFALPGCAQQILPIGEAYSVHNTIRPGLYSGFMRTIVQLKLGIGKVYQETYEQKLIESEAIRPFKDEVQGRKQDPSAYQLYNPAVEIPITCEVGFDYRFNRTHGIAWDNLGQAYVVEIGQRGVSAMRLPLDPVSLRDNGRARYLELFPELALSLEGETIGLLDKMGGFPSPVGYPLRTEDFNAAVKAGIVAKALDNTDMSPFYTKNAYSSCFGWAFNFSGTRADNTCYEPLTGYKKGYHYRVVFSLEVVELTEEEKTVKEVREALLRSFITQLFSFRTLTAVEKVKAGRLTDEDLEALGLIESVEDKYDYFTELEVAAEFIFTARLVKIKSGILYHPAPLYAGTGTNMTPSPCPQWKIPEPLFPTCDVPLLSFDFSGYRTLQPRPLCDTPIFVFYKQDALVVLNYFWRDTRTPNTDIWGNVEPVTTGSSSETGSESETIIDPGTNTGGCFYSNCWDPRRETTGAAYYSRHYEKNDIIGHDFFMSFCDTLARFGKINTRIWNKRYNENLTRLGENNEIYVFTPYGDRSMFYMLHYYAEYGVTEIKSLVKPYILALGPVTKHVSIYHPAAHFLNLCKLCAPGTEFQGFKPTCMLSEYAPETVEPNSAFPSAPVPTVPDYQVGYYSNDCTGNSIYLTVAYQSWPPNDWKGYEGPEWLDVVRDNEHTYKWKLRIFGDNIAHGTVLLEGSEAGEGSTGDPFTNYILDPWWRWPSPTLDNQTPYSFAMVNYWGNTLVNIPTEFNFDIRHYGGPEEMYVNPQTACYVGYVA